MCVNPYICAHPSIYPYLVSHVLIFPIFLLHSYLIHHTRLATFYYSHSSLDTHCPPAAVHMTIEQSHLLVPLNSTTLGTRGDFRHRSSSVSIFEYRLLQLWRFFTLNCNNRGQPYTKSNITEEKTRQASSFYTTGP